MTKLTHPWKANDLIGSSLPLLEDRGRFDLSLHEKPHKQKVKFTRDPSSIHTGWHGVGQHMEGSHPGSQTFIWASIVIIPLLCGGIMTARGRKTRKEISAQLLLFWKVLVFLEKWEGSRKSLQAALKKTCKPWQSSAVLWVFLLSTCISC